MTHLLYMTHRCHRCSSCTPPSARSVCPHPPPPTARLAVLGNTLWHSLPVRAMARQVPLARFVVPNPTFAVQPSMVNKFEELVYTGNVAQELLFAQDYLKGPAAQDNYAQPMGIAVAKARCVNLYEQFQKVVAPTAMSFSATIWMLDLSHRLIGIDKLDLARMRWAVESVAETGSLRQVMDGFPVAAESIPAAEEYTGLRKIERDADLDAIVLVVYWNRPEIETEKHPWHDHLKDLHCKAQRAGHGAAASVERFIRFDAEDRKRGHGFVDIPARDRIEGLGGRSSVTTAGDFGV